MRYELFLRSPAALDGAVMPAAAAAVAAKTFLELEPYADGELVLGLDLSADADDPRAAGALCEVAFGLAAAHELSVFDPQLGRVISAGDEPEVRRQVEQLSAFAGAALTSLPEQQDSGRASNLWIWLVLGGSVALLWLANRFLAG